MGLCGFPGCTTKCVQEDTAGNQSEIIADIAHIEPSRDGGPRANPSLSQRERDSYRNLILLCPTHHREIDRYPEEYNVSRLRELKEGVEKRYARAMAQETQLVTFLELEMVTRNLANTCGPASASISIVPLKEKMDRNGLTLATESLFKIGLLQVKQVEQFVQHMSGLDSAFVADLTYGFVDHYRQLRSQGIEGDSLFNEMQLFSSQGNIDPRRQGAGLAVLVYLFERCEVFDR